MRALYRRTDGGLIGDACRLTGRVLSATRGRVYSKVVQFHAWLHFGEWRDRTGSGRAAVGQLHSFDVASAERDAYHKRIDAEYVTGRSQPDPLCGANCEVIGGDQECDCLAAARPATPARLGIDEKGNYLPAPFTGTPYDPNSEED